MFLKAEASACKKKKNFLDREMDRLLVNSWIERWLIAF